MRIISLVPSQTELLYTLGLEDEVVGITKFCIHPDTWFRTKTRVGGTKNIHPGIIDSLRPDLILANKEENDRQQVEDLASRYTVWVSDVKSLPDALDMIRTVGSLTHRNARARSLAEEIQQRFDTLKPLASSLTAAYLIWRDPYMSAGGDTFIHDMLRRCGLTNLLSATNRYPIVDTGTLSRCDLILLSSEPYPFREKHITELKKLLPSPRTPIIQLVDGQIFSWYGSRLLGAPSYFRELQRAWQPKYPV
ncbi:MAG: ABC transporter substrate-binding protein [Bacteroidetes bacterium]|nr:ABC transporter substrate-binding protein [Bacteroidota bacterium]